MEDSIMDLVEPFNQFDWIVIGVICISAGHGLMRGLAREATSFLGWVGAFFLANILALSVSENMTNLIDDRSIRYLVAWSLVFISVVFFFGSIGRWVSNQIRQPGLNFGNRLLGAGFGVARGVIIAAILVLMLKGLLPKSEDYVIDESELVEYIEVVAEWLADNFEDIVNGDAAPLVDETITSSNML
ncbi:MAG: CvpA family protein [Pseudomonadota bacterium]|nr:CvpA family protein [Pseudomonadota bacterium]